jgi:hypothetical protein
MPEELKNAKYPTDVEIEAWKQQHGRVYEIQVDEKKCWLRKPKRKDLSHAMTVGKKDGLKFNEAILNDCWLGGDSEIKTDDDLFMAASNVLDEIIEFKQAEVKKL